MNPYTHTQGDESGDEIPMPTEKASRQELIEWAYEVSGSGLTIRTLCNLKTELQTAQQTIQRIADEGNCYRCTDIAKDYLGREEPSSG